MRIRELGSNREFRLWLNLGSSFSTLTFPHAYDTTVEIALSGLGLKQILSVSVQPAVSWMEFLCTRSIKQRLPRLIFLP